MLLLYLLLYKPVNSKYISESETEHSEARLEMILNGTTFHQVTEISNQSSFKNP